MQRSRASRTQHAAHFNAADSRPSKTLYIFLIKDYAKLPLIPNILFARSVKAEGHISWCMIALCSCSRSSTLQCEQTDVSSCRSESHVVAYISLLLKGDPKSDSGLVGMETSNTCHSGLRA